MNYKDMTFCDFKECSLFSTCHRALTEEVINSAHKWWGSEDAPISMYMEKPKCFKEKP